MNIKTLLKKNRGMYLRIAGIYGFFRGLPLRAIRTLCGIDGNKVVFSAFDSRSYNDNPRYISEKLHELRPETEIVWLFKDAEAAKKQFEVPDYVHCFHPLKTAGIAQMATARVLVDNYSKRFYYRFAKGKQTYIQTWHGDRAFKKVGYDNPRRINPFIEEHCDLCITGSDYGDRQFHSAFHYYGEIMKVGYPRNDILVHCDPDQIAAVRNRLGIDDGIGILLYAPTFRDRAKDAQRAEKPHLDPEKLLDALEETTGRKWICLMRAHYLSFGLISENSARIRNVSAYPEMAELLLAADALITDYSSCAGDFALTRRPIWLYQDDLEDYSGHDRALYFDMKDSPYLVASTPEEMDALIRTTTPESAKENCDAILRFYGEAETGHAAQSIAEYIIAKLDDAGGHKK